MDIEKRKINEKKFESWEELKDGGRRYWYTVIGRSRWKAVYVKEVNKNEGTVRFYQNIYDSVDLLKFQSFFRDGCQHIV